MRDIPLLACWALTACGPAPAQLADGFLFDPNWILEVHIELDGGHFEQMRHQARDFDDVFCASEPPPNPYTYFEADITIDDITVGSVGVRKKGFFGSVEPGRPSFKVSFDHYVRGQRFFGMRRLTLNNARSDPAKIKQCLGYELFAAAGVPAPRCNFAHVTVNHEDLGLYVHLESIKTELLDRIFNDTTGNLYEGALSDFQPNWIDTFQRKTNLENPDRSDLEWVMAAAEAPDDDLIASLDKVIALDAFFDFWVMEVIIAHWDGYASFNHNNYYIYNNPRTGRFHFIPWGIDGIFFDKNDALRSVFADSILAYRLYALEESRGIYTERLLSTLDEVWNEGQILTRIDAMEALIEGLADPFATGELGRQIEAVRDFVRHYPQAIREELNNGPVVWEKPLADPPCWREIGSLVASFATTWGTLGVLDPFGVGTGSWQVTWQPEGQDPWVEIAARVAATAGLNRDVQPGQPAKPTLQVIGVISGESHDTLAAAVLEFPDANMVAPGTLPVGIAGEGAFGVLFTVDPTVEGSEQYFFLDGEVVFDEAASTTGAAVMGSLTADIRETGW